MKIAYVNYLASISSLPGVEVAVKARYNAVQRCNLAIDFFIITCEAYQDDRFSMIRLDQKLVGMARQRALARALQTISNTYDVIILRKMPYSPWLLGFLRKTKANVIMEHHTLVASELWLTKQYLAWLSELCFSRLCQRYISGHISVTHEIANKEIVSNAPIRVIANGFSTDRMVKRVPLSRNDPVHLLFAVSQLLPWHGFERLVQSLQQYQGIQSLVLHCAGPLTDKDITNMGFGDLPKTVTIVCHGLLSSGELSKLASTCDVGIATLALYKKNMQEACSLKTRLYLCEQLPFVYAYNDPDFNHDDVFCLHYCNDASLLCLDRLVSFVVFIRENFPAIQAAMSEKVSAISVEKKMQAYYDFAKSLI